MRIKDNYPENHDIFENMIVFPTIRVTDFNWSNQVKYIKPCIHVFLAIDTEFLLRDWRVVKHVIRYDIPFENV